MGHVDEVPPSVVTQPMISDARIALFEASLGRCLAKGDFVQAFYEEFLQASPDVARKFENTDFSKQRGVMKNSLYMMARFALGIEDGQSHLESIAESHSRRHLDITPGLYVLWLESLLKTAAVFDSEYNAEIEAAWRELFEAGISRMISVYRQRKTIPPIKNPDA